MSTRTILLIVAGISFVIGVIAAFAERRRHQRRNLDEVGWVPWTTVMVMAMCLVIGCVGFALRVDD